MSEFFVSEEEARQARLDTALTPPERRGFWDRPFEGTGTDLLGGAAGGFEGLSVFMREFSRASRQLNNIGDPNTDNFVERYFTQRQEVWRDYRRHWTVDPATRSESANIIGGLTRLMSSATVTSLVGGPAGALTGPGGTGTGVGLEAEERLLAQGVDPEAAREAAFREGAWTSALVSLPVSLPGRLWQRALSGAGINAGVGAAMRYDMNEQLTAAGYPEVAAQYQWRDPQAATIDVLFGAIFGAAFGHRAPVRRTVDPETGQVTERAPESAEDWLDAARQYAQDAEPDMAQAYAHALIARDLGHPEADGIAALIEEEATPDQLEQGRGLATEYAQAELAREAQMADLGAAAVLQRDAMHAELDSAPGVPADSFARRAHSEALRLAQEQAADDMPLDVTQARVDEAEFISRDDDFDADEIAALIREDMEQSGLADRISEVEERLRRAEDHARARGIDPDALFSFGPRRGESDARGNARFYDDRLTASENKAVEMARNNYSNEEIADEMDTSVGAVRVHLARAKSKVPGLRIPPMRSGVRSGVNPRSGERTATIQEIVALYNKLWRQGYRNRVGTPMPGVRNINTIIAERLGISANSVKQRLFHYRRDLAAGRIEGEALFSQGEDAGVSSVEALRERAREEFGADWDALERAGLANFVESRAEVPYENWTDIPPGVKAVHLRSTGKTYFIANAIRPEDLRGLILHEIGVHHGMEAMLGKRGFKEVLRQIDRMVEAEHPDVVTARETAAYYNRGRPNAIPEETLAYLVEINADLPLVNRILSRLRQWLIKTFGSTFGMRLTVDDLRALAVASLRRVAEKARREAGEVTPIEPVPVVQGPDAGPRLGESATQAPDGGAGGAGLLPRQVLNDWLVRGNDRLIRNPTHADLERLAELGDELKYVSDTQGNRYVFNAVDAHHNGAMRALRDHGVEVESLGPGAEITNPDAAGFIFREPDGSFAHEDANFKATGTWAEFVHRTRPATPAPNDGAGGAQFSQGTRQNRENLLGARRDPIEGAGYQRRIAELRSRTGGEAAPRRAVGEPGEEPGGVGRVRGDADAGPKRIGTDQQSLRDVLSVSGIRLFTRPGRDVKLGKYRLSIDTPIASDADVALLASETASTGDFSRIDFDFVDGSDPKDARLPGVHIAYTRAHPETAGMRVGEWMYRQLIDWAQRRGLPVYSDGPFGVSVFAQRTYRRLREAGFVVEEISRRVVEDPSDGALVSKDGLPVFRVSMRDPVEPHVIDAAPPPREDYQIDGPTLRERQQRIDEANARQAAHDALSPAEQALKDNPDADFSFGPRRNRQRVSAEALMRNAEAEAKAAQALREGFATAARCGARHAGLSASYIVQAPTQAASASILLGQGLGLTMSIPVGIWGAPMLARHAPIWLEQNTRERFARARIAGEWAGYHAGLDMPSSIVPMEGVPFSAAAEDMPDYPIGPGAVGPLESAGNALDEQVVVSEGAAPGVQPSGARVPPAPVGFFPEGAEVEDGSALISMFDQLLEGDEE